jgi:hypothetical protein
MKNIGREIVLPFWEKACKMDEKALIRQFNQMQTQQPQIASFLAITLRDVSEENVDDGIAIAFVILKSFEKAYGKKMPEVSIKTLQGTWDQMHEEMMKLEGASDMELLETAKKQIGTQFFLNEFLLTVLFEGGEDDGPLMGADETGQYFFIFRSLINALETTLSSSVDAPAAVPGTSKKPGKAFVQLRKNQEQTIKTPDGPGKRPATRRAIGRQPRPKNNTPVGATSFLDSSTRTPGLPGQAWMPKKSSPDKKPVGRGKT